MDDFYGDIVLGIVGAVIGQLSTIISKDDPDGTIKRMKAPGLWVAVVFQCIVAGILVYVYLKSGQHLGPMLSLNVGVSADVILRGLTRAASPPILPGSTDQPKPASEAADGS